MLLGAGGRTAFGSLCWQPCSGMLRAAMAGARRARVPRERLSFNSGWRFHRGEAPDAGGSLRYDELRDWLVATGTQLINEGVSKPVRPQGNPGAEVSFVRPDHDDRAWRKLDLPHDWGIEGPFSQELPGETGKLGWPGVGWYRKHVALPKSDAGRRIALELDGAMAYSAIWVNAKLVGGWPYGYSSFQVDLTQQLKFGGDNVLAIRLHNPPDSSRWYPGSGIYRNAWLTKTNPVRVAHWGVFVSTAQLSAASAVVNVDVTIENTSEADAELRLRVAVYELGPDGESLGKLVAEAEPIELEVPAGVQALRSPTARVKRPKLWSLRRRNRYVAVTTLEQNGILVDRVQTRFGIRALRFDPDYGFFLNGERVPMRGVCLHHDQGALGTAVHVRALERQLESLQQMGCNAIRTSHNPPAPELLELCDRMGMLVMDEAFDCWRRGKKWPAGKHPRDPDIEYFDYARVFDDWHERDLRAMVRRDRNHPSVVLWSIGNEVLEQRYADGWKLAVRLAGIVREEDRTRPITSAFNAELAGYSGFQTAVDVVGYNYRPWAYRPLHEHNPSVPVLGSETASCISSRGEYFFPLEADRRHGRVDFHVSSYDQSAADWALVPDDEFRGLDECPFVAGEFVWTGFDYLGEPTPYNSDSTNLLNFSDPAERMRMAAQLERLGRIRVPARSSYFGIVDLAGFAKDRYYLYQARWRPELRMAHILPHWNWPERVGKVTPVHVYSSADEAELLLNGRSQGRRRRSPLEYRFRWDEVVYEPGELKVVTYKRGKKWATAVRRTTGEAVRLSLSADRTTLAADGRDLCFVTLKVTDARAQLVPRERRRVSFGVRGPAQIVAVDNGDPTDQTCFQALERSTFNGLALVILRTRAGRGGAVTLRASSPGLAAATVTVRTTAR
jgi:beta-galactosidase